MMNVKEAYKQGKNIQHLFREQRGSQENNTDAILWSYDLQAGTYRDFYHNGYSDNFHISGIKTPMSARDFTQLKAQEIARIFNKFNPETILEVGVGEATTLADVLLNLPSNEKLVSVGVDLSPSRILVGNEFLIEKKISTDKCTLAVADMFNLPFCDEQFDIVFTSHTIESNTFSAKQALQELYRVTKKHLVLIEPSYDLGNVETRNHIDEYKYIKDLYSVASSLGFKIIRHELFKYGTYNNQSSLIIIEKVETSKNNLIKENIFFCSRCKSDLDASKEHFYCNCCGGIFPKIEKIPLLRKEDFIIFNNYLGE